MRKLLIIIICSWATSGFASACGPTISQGGDGDLILSPFVPTLPEKAFRLYHPLLIPEGGRWQVGNQVFWTQFSPTDYFTNRVSPRSRAFLARYEEWPNRRTYGQVLDALDYNTMLYWEIDQHSSHLWQYYEGREILTAAEIRLEKRAELLLPLYRKRFFVSVDPDTYETEIIVRLFDASVMFGGRDTGLPEFKDSPQNYQTSFERKYPRLLFPERLEGKHKRIYDLGRLWKTPLLKKSARLIMARVSESLAYQNGPIPYLPEGTIYIEATEGGKEAYLREGGFKVRYTPEQLKAESANPDEKSTPTYLLYIDAEDFFAQYNTLSPGVTLTRRASQ